MRKGGGATFINRFQGLLDLLFPRACPLCHLTLPQRHTGLFCLTCRQGMLPLPASHCPRCALPFASATTGPHLCATCQTSAPPFLSTHAAGLYDENLKDAIHHFKYSGGHHLDRPLATLMFETLDSIIPPDIIVPVPLHINRLRHRTYNQSLLIAREVGRLLGRPVQPEGLARVRDTRPQQGLGASQRARNLTAAFTCPAPFHGAQVLLVDHVMTPGATAIACSRTLLQHGASAVRVAILGRAPRP